MVPYEEGMHVLGCIWMFRTKLNADGTLDKKRSRLVAKGNEQEEGIYYLDTFSPVIRTATIIMVLHIATLLQWDVRKFDVKTRFFTVIYMRRFIWNNQLVLWIKITWIMYVFWRRLSTGSTRLRGRGLTNLAPSCLSLASPVASWSFNVRLHQR